MATSGAAVAAAIVARARREVREHFEARNAFSAKRAVAYDPPDHMHQRQFGQMVGRGVLRPTGDGRYWMDRNALLLEQERRRAALKKVLLIIVIGIVVAIAIATVMIRVVASG